MVIVPHLLILRRDVPKQWYSAIQIIGLVSVDSLGSTFPNHTSPVIALPSSLQRDHRRLVVDAVCGCDDLDLVVLLVLVLRPDHFDNLVIAENVDSPLADVESAVPVVDIAVVLAFVVVFVGMFVVASELQLSIGQRSIAAGFE